MCVISLCVRACDSSTATDRFKSIWTNWYYFFWHFGCMRVLNITHAFAGRDNEWGENARLRFSKGKISLSYALYIY